MKRKLLIIVVALMMLSGAVMGDIETRQRSIAESFFKEGVYYYNQQEYTAASNALIRSLSSDPTYYKARYWLGRAYYQSGYTKNALVEWERVLNLVGEDHLLKNKVTRLLYQTVGGQPKLPLEEKYLSTKGLYHPVRREITNPTSIYIDKSKLCWVVGYSTNNVISYDKNGNKMMALSPGDKGFKRPYDIVANSRGELYVSDFGNDRVVKFSNDGSYLSSVGRSGINNGEFYGPQGIALDKYDNLFVVDKGNHRVQKFNPQGDFLIEFGKEGRDRDNMLNPSDVLVVANKIYVTDTGNRRIQVFDLSGNWVKNLGEDVFVEPKGLKRVNDNEILVADKGLGVMKLGLNPLEIKVIKKTEHGLRSPVDIALDNNRFLYVADVNELDIRVYVPEKMKYSGLDISILQTFSPGYPDRGTLKWVLGLFTNAALSSGRVTHRVLVRDQQRNPIFGLNKENFKVFERGVIHSVNVLSEHTIKKKASVVILNERSYDMKRHSRRLDKVSREFLGKLDSTDSVEVINFNENYWVAQGFVSNILSPLRAIKESKYTRNKIIGNPLYKSVTDIFTRQRDIGAVVLFTSGKIDEMSFRPYSYEVCLNYAKNNHVPVYVVAFDEGPMTEEFKDLARLTGGKYYNAYSSNELSWMAKRIKSYKQSIYFVQYDSTIPESKAYKWRDVRVEVKVKDLFGQDLAGYYVN